MKTIIHKIPIILKENLLLTLIILLGLLVRFWGINFGLPLELHSDEHIFIMHALKFGTGDFNPHDFLYPSLTYYLLFILFGFYFVFGYIVGLFHSASDFATLYFTDPSSFYIIGRSLMALLGGATVFIVYLMGKKLFESKVGLVSALFMAFIFWHVRNSHFIKPDVLTTFFVSLTFLFAVYIFLSGDTKFYILCGMMAGLAVASKYTGGVITVCIVMAHILNSFKKQNLLKIIFSGKLLLGFFFILIGFFIGSPFAFLDFNSFFPYIIDLSKQVEMAWIGSNYYGNFWLLTLTQHLKAGMGLHFELLGLFGLLYCLVYKRKKEDLLLVSFPILYFMIFGGMKYNFPRFWIPIFPFLLIMGSRLLNEIIFNTRFFMKERGTILAFVSVLFIIPSVVSDVKYDLLISNKYTSNLAQEWIENNIPPNTKIVVEKRFGLDINRSAESIMAERDRELYLSKTNSLKESESHMIESLSEPYENNKQYYDFLLAIPEEEKSYYVYNAWSAGEKEYSYYVDNGFRYIVIGLIYRDYRAQPEKYPNVNRFYEELFDKGELIKEFIPNDINQPGSHIRVYRIS